MTDTPTTPTGAMVTDSALTAENIESIARALAGDKYDEHGWSCRHLARQSIMELRKQEHERYKIDAELETKRLAAMPAAELTTPEPDGLAIAHDEAIQAYHTDITDLRERLEVAERQLALLGQPLPYLKTWTTAGDTATPTGTPEPDGWADADNLNMHGVAIGELVGRVNGLAEAIASQARVGMEMQNDDAVLYRRLDAHDAALDGLKQQHETARKINNDNTEEFYQHLKQHDAALAELRDGFDMLTSRVTTHGRRLGRVDPLPSIEDLRGIFAPTPPAVPDAVESASDEARWNRVVHAWKEEEDDAPTLAAERENARAAVAKALELGLTPTPPPIVVDDEAQAAYHAAYNESRSKTRDHASATRAGLNAVAAHWNATRVPAGDDMEDTQGDER